MQTRMHAYTRARHDAYRSVQNDYDLISRAYVRLRSASQRWRRQLGCGILFRDLEERGILIYNNPLPEMCATWKTPNK